MTKPGVRPWAALTDASILQAVASWNWLHAYFETYENNDSVKIGFGKMSKLLQPLTIVSHTVPGCATKFYASMGNHTYAGIGFELHVFIKGGTRHFTFHANGNLDFLYIVDPDNWHVIPYVATRLEQDGIVMRECDSPLPLIQHTLRQNLHTLSPTEITELVDLIGLKIGESAADEVKKSDCSDNFLALAKHFHQGESQEKVQEEVSLYEKALLQPEDIDRHMLADPLCEAAFNDLNDEDKSEFREIADAKNKAIMRQRKAMYIDALVVHEKPKKPRYTGPPRAKGRPKGAAKAQATPPPAPEAETEADTDSKADTESQSPTSSTDTASQEEAPHPEPQPASAASDDLPDRPTDNAPREETPPPAAQPASVASEDLPNHPASAHARSANYGCNLDWVEINCNLCSSPMARKKFMPCPGFRDKETWKMTIRDHSTGSWASKTPLMKLRLQSVIAREAESAKIDVHEWIFKWAEENRTCCGENKKPDEPPQEPT